jgi:predicted nuclease of predicted toxin-antitoxin system
MKFPVDMNLSPAWVEFLARAGFEAVHWSQIGPSDAVDSDVMEWAAKHGQIVLTADLDFGAILAATRQAKPSVLQVRSDDLSPDAIGAMVVRSIRQGGAELENGAILSIDTARARLRILPLER